MPQTKVEERLSQLEKKLGFIEDYLTTKFPEQLKQGFTDQSKHILEESMKYTDSRIPQPRGPEVLSTPVPENAVDTNPGSVRGILNDPFVQTIGQGLMKILTNGGAGQSSDIGKITIDIGEILTRDIAKNISNDFSLVLRNRLERTRSAFETEFYPRPAPTPHESPAVEHR